VKAIHFKFRMFYDDQVRKQWGAERASAYGVGEAEDFRLFLRRMFDEARRKKARALIIDLRENRGGHSILGFQLLKYVDLGKKTMREFSSQLKRSKPVVYEYFMTPWDRVKAKLFGIWPPDVGTLTSPEEERYGEAVERKGSHFFMPPVNPQSKFQGKIYVLISNTTFSSAMEFATLLSDNRLATVVGEPTGGKPNAFGNIMVRELPNTGIKFGVSSSIYSRPDSTRKGDVALLPDVEVPTTYSDYSKGIDRPLDWVREQIRSASK
jgi:C-terminal processing protease CtpA/Prc